MRRVRVSIRRPASMAMTLLVINVAVFLVEIALGGPNIPVLVQMGAMVPSLVAAGDYWRLLAAMFLHATLLHLLFNAFGLYIFGSLIEGVLGRLRFVAIFFITGISASAASFAFGSPLRVAVGASGAVFGLLGAWLAYNWRRRESGLAQANIRGGLLLIGLNLFLGFSVPGIDNTAHVAGLVAGFAAGLTAEGFGRRAVRAATQVAGFAVLLAAAASLVVWRVDTLTA
ncbi:MAG: rhomboid family intramembrane serine protease [Actinomycetota bacterium]